MGESAGGLGFSGVGSCRDAKSDLEAGDDAERDDADVALVDGLLC